MHITARITFIHVFIRSSNIWLLYILNQTNLHNLLSRLENKNLKSLRRRKLGRKLHDVFILLCFRTSYQRKSAKVFIGLVWTWEMSPKKERVLFRKLSEGPFKRFQHLTNIRSTKVERMLCKCWNHLNRPFNIFENIGKVESMLNEILNRFEFDSTRFQQAFNIFYVFNNVGRPDQTHRTFGSTKCWMQVEANVETV